MEINQLDDLIYKISLQCNNYITNYDAYEDFHYDGWIKLKLDNKYDSLLTLPIDSLKKEIENIIIASFTSDKKIWLDEDYVEERWLNNVPNQTIVEDTHYQQGNTKEIDFSGLKKTLHKCFQSLNTYDSPDSNSFLLDKIDLALYKTLTTHPELMKSLNWRTFEKLIADIVETFGYQVELMQGTKDNGIDVVAIKKVDTFGIHRYLIQAKRWTNKVGVEPVQQLLFKQSDIGATKSCLVTTSQFTSGAWQLANRYKYILELKDFEKIQDWLKVASVLKSKINIDGL